MGVCAACTSRRPPDSQEQEQFIPSENDKFFAPKLIEIPVPTEQELEQMKKSADRKQVEKAKNNCKRDQLLVENQLKDAQQRLDEAEKAPQEEKDSQSRARLLFEIRKGKDIFNTGCCSESRPYVKVRVLPSKQKWKSIKDLAWVPKWFQVNEFKNEGEEPIAKMIVKVINKDGGTHKKLGKWEKDLSEADTDTQIETAKLSIEGNFKEAGKGLEPQIEVRYQFIPNYIEFWRQRAEYLKDLLKNLEKANDDCMKILDTMKPQENLEEAKIDVLNDKPNEKQPGNDTSAGRKSAQNPPANLPAQNPPAKLPAQNPADNKPAQNPADNKPAQKPADGDSFQNAVEGEDQQALPQEQKVLQQQAELQQQREPQQQNVGKSEEPEMRSSVQEVSQQEQQQNEARSSVQEVPNTDQAQEDNNGDQEGEGEEENGDVRGYHVQEIKIKEDDPFDIDL